MKTSDQINELAGALSNFQASIKPIPKRSKNKVGRGGKITIKYASLDDLLDTVRIPLKKEGLAFIQAPYSTDSTLKLTTRLMHTSGQWVEESFTIPELSESEKHMNTIQAMGAQLTYARRYALSAMLGLATDEDTDANMSNGNGKTEQKKPDNQKEKMLYNGKNIHEMRSFAMEKKGLTSNGWVNIVNNDPINIKGWDDITQEKLKTLDEIINDLPISDPRD